MTNPHPYAATGTISELRSGRRVIALDPSSTGNAFEFEALPIDTPVRILYWTNAPEGERSEIETIAERQNLQIDIVAHGLESSGVLAKDRQGFLDRLPN